MSGLSLINELPTGKDIKTGDMGTEYKTIWSHTIQFTPNIIHGFFSMNIPELGTF